MNQASIAKHLPFTWDDYQSWDDGQRWELVGGEAYAMSPAPSPRHQQIQFQLALQLGNHLKGLPCRPFNAPVDVRLSDIDVVQPDILVVCNPEQIKPSHIEGAPALIVKILSPSTAHHDRGPKMDLYARSGVEEVWLVTQWPACIEVFVLDGNSYRRYPAFTQGQTLKSPTLPAVEINLTPVFDFPLEPEEKPMEMKEPPGHYRG